jgi:hypothetical protein
MLTEATQLMTQLHTERHLPYAALCALADLPYSSFMRWHGRLRRQQPVVAKPGPPKIEFDLRPLRERLRELAPGPHRCPGAGALYAEYASGISRRDFQELTHDVYLEQRHEELAAMTRITWHYPGTVWGVDDLHVGQTAAGDLLWNTTIADLASSYRLPEPLLGTPVGGEELAGHLDHLFAKYGAPLLVKEDNAPNLNHPMVAEVCAAYGVLRLISPARWPRFNGGIEHSQGEVRVALRRCGADDRDLPREHAPAHLACTAHDDNHKPRRELQNKTACQVFTNPALRLTVNRQTRKEILDAVDQLTVQLLATIYAPTDWQQAAAYRQAAEAVLEHRGIFSASVARKVLPSFLTPSLS